MGMTTPLLNARRFVEHLLNLPRPLLDRLLSLRRAYPKTPLNNLPEPVRREVKQILTKSSTTSAPQATSLRPTAPHGQRQPSPANGSTRPTLPGNTATLWSVLGTKINTGRDIVISQKERQQGLYIIGANGTGKTTLLCNLILSDIRHGLGIYLIEPHGDLTAQVLAGIPRHRLNDVIYLDVEDYEFPFGLNLFEIPQQRTVRTMAATASFISHLWEVLWHSGFETPRLMQNLRAVTRTLIANPGSTFTDIPMLYANSEVRAHMLANVTNNTQILQFWEDYERKNQRDKDAYIESTLNKVQAFLDEPMIQHILAQTKTTIDLRYIMDNSKILLIKLSPQFSEASNLIGAVVIGKLLMTAFSRADTPESKRTQFNLYCNEFHRFASSDFATLISEARKFRISTTISNQTLAQLSEANRTSALAAGNLIVFRVSGLDAPVLSGSFDTTPKEPYVIGEEAIRAPTNDTIHFLLGKAHTNPDAMACNHYLEYLLHFAGLSVPLPPVHTPRGHYPNRRDSRAESVLEGMGDAVAVTLCTLFDRRKYRKAQGLVTDARHCILLLNEYFSQVMLKRDSSLPIPHEVMSLFGHREFLNCEGLTRNPALLPMLSSVEFASAHFPIAKLREAGYWGRADAAYARLCDFLTCLWTVVISLARDPILVDTGQYRPRLQNRTYQDMENQIARDLANAPNFTAKVKILSREYTIRTKPAPQSLTGDALTQRIEAVKRHCRALGYTRHYTEVIDDLRKRHEFLFGLGDTSDEDAADDGDDPDEPPRGSFSLD